MQSSLTLDTLRVNVLAVLSILMLQVYSACQYKQIQYLQSNFAPKDESKLKINEPSLEKINNMSAAEQYCEF